MNHMYVPHTKLALHGMKWTIVPRRRPFSRGFWVPIKVKERVPHGTAFSDARPVDFLGFFQTLSVST